MKVMVDGQFVDRVVLTEDEYFDLIDERDKYRATLKWIAEEANTGESGDAGVMRDAAIEALAE